MLDSSLTKGSDDKQYSNSILLKDKTLKKAALSNLNLNIFVRSFMLLLGMKKEYREAITRTGIFSSFTDILDIIKV